jgi:hypothetical protein
MECLLLAVRKTHQIGAVVEMLPRSVHPTLKLSLKNDTLVRDPLGEVVIDLPDQPIVVADVSRDSK